MRAYFRVLRQRAVLACLFVALAVPAWSNDIEQASGGELERYVADLDDSFRWREVTSGRIGSVDYVEYLLTSQTWRGIEWKHQFFVLRPAGMSAQPRSALLFVHGGRWKPEYEGERHTTNLPREARHFARLAEAIRAPVGVLRQVPFQPIFERREDALIAYTLDQYLRTGERDWPILLPMVKSVVRAMDAMQSIVRERWDVSIEAFTIAGASKRGWTSWLTAAVDPRVMAVAPMVIDVLNMRAQMEHQRETWGELSEEIQDYASLDLPARLQTPRGSALLSMVDPFSYRAELTRAKLIMLSTNDRYWPLDALKLYWSELPDPKHVIYVPNQGHGLRDVNRVIGALSALHRYATERRPLPHLGWSFAPTPERIAIEIETQRPASRVLVWTATSPTKDFRSARWTSRTCSRHGAAHSCTAERSRNKYTAVFGEVSFKDKGHPRFSVTTTVCIAAPGGATPKEC